MANKKRRKQSHAKTNKTSKGRVKLSHEDQIKVNGALQQAAQAMAQGQLDRAVQLYQFVLQLDPGQGVALEQLGMLMYKAGRMDVAQQLLSDAVARDPRNVRAWYMLACVLSESNQSSEAITAYERCIAIKPELVEAHNNLGVIYKNTEQFELAAKSFKEVVKRQPKSAFALSNLGNVLKDAGYMEKALGVLQQAITADPYLASAYSNLLITLNYLDHVSAAEIYDMHRAWQAHVPRSIEPNRFDFERETARAQGPEKGQKIRLGLVSPDLHLHSVAFFIAPMFEKLNRQHFELYVYYNNNRHDEVQQRFSSLSDQWLQVDNMTEAELANRIFSDQVDVLIDLAGHTANNLLAVFYQKPAPVQISWIGYPNTTGLSQMDYRLVDAVTDPPGVSDDLASEQLVRLEHAFLCYDPMMSSSEALAVGKLPAIDNGYVTFGSFNNLLKITDGVIKTWADVLNAVKDSRLLIKSRQLGNQMTRDRVLKRFEQCGIQPDRLLLHEMVPDRVAHLRLYHQVDIALDTFPYNGTTTTCEALWMGVPVLTLAGATHASRVGASLLGCLSLHDFIASDCDDYVDKAARHAADLGGLAEKRSHMRPQMERSVLCDQVGFMKRFEAAFESLWQAYTNKK